MKSHLLLATDLLKGSHSLAIKAQEIANKLAATLSIIHVIETPITEQYAHALGFSELLEPSRESAQEVLATLSDELNIPLEHQFIEKGTPSFYILELAKQLKVDGIIIGSHNHSVLPDFLNSTASKIVHQAHCDVFTLRTK